jgi:hypothetical protein
LLLLRSLSTAISSSIVMDSVILFNEGVVLRGWVIWDQRPWNYFSQVSCEVTFILTSFSSLPIFFFFYNFVSLWLRSRHIIFQLRYESFPAFPVFSADFTFGYCLFRW